MSSIWRAAVFALAAGAAAFCAAAEEGEAPEGENQAFGADKGITMPPIQGFRLPEYDEQGRITRQLFGDTATFLQDGIIQLTGLTLEFFHEGELVVRASSPFCAFDQKRRRAAGRETIRIVAEKALITGNGFAWNGESEQFQIFDDAKLVIDNKKMDTGGLLGVGEGGGGEKADGGKDAGREEERKK